MELFNAVHDDKLDFHNLEPVEAHAAPVSAEEQRKRDAAFGDFTKRADYTFKLQQRRGAQRSELTPKDMLGVVRQARDDAREAYEASKDPTGQVLGPDGRPLSLKDLQQQFEDEYLGVIQNLGLDIGDDLERAGRPVFPSTSPGRGVLRARPRSLSPIPAPGSSAPTVTTLRPRVSDADTRHPRAGSTHAASRWRASWLPVQRGSAPADTGAAPR